jgi:hypothetical protein
MKNHADTGNHARPPLNIQGLTEIPRTNQDKRTWKRMQAHAIPCRTQRNHKQTNEDKWNRPMRSAHIGNRASTRQGKTSQEQHPTLTP